MPSLSRCIDEFLEFKKAQRLSHGTLVDYEIVLRRFAKEIGDPEIERIDRKTIVHYLASLQFSKKRVKNIHTSLSSLWTWAVSEGYCSSHILRQIKPPRPEKRPILPFTREQILDMLESTHSSKEYSRPGKRACRNRLKSGLRDRAIILLLLDTGIRASELCGIRIKDIKPGGVYVQGKGSKDRIVPLSEPTRSALLAYLGDRKDPDDFVFKTEQGHPLTRDALRLIIRRIGDRAGVNDAHPHRFRHTFAITFLRNGGDPFTLQMILGHETLDMVRRYLAIAQSDIDSVHRRASPVKAWGL